MKNIVKVIGGREVVSSLDIAKFSGNGKRAVHDLINQYKNDIEDFGKIVENTDAVGGRIYDFTLNEYQALFLLTLMKNTKNIIIFKKNLTMQFFTMRDILEERFRKTESKLLIENVKLKKDRAKYGSLASGDKKYRTLDWIRRNGGLDNSTNWMYIQLCEAEHIHDELLEIHSYIPISSISMMKKDRILFHVDDTLKFFDGINASRGESYLDARPTFDFEDVENDR